MTATPRVAPPPAPAAADIPGRCYRCGNPTRSPDIGLCDSCNPSGIAGPTATQVHGLILASVAGALIVLALAAKLLASGGGPFPAAVVGQASHPDGTIEIVVRITNQGSSPARPTCTLVRGPEDSGVEFLADRIDAGASIETTKRVAAPPLGSAQGLAQITCR